MPMTLQGATDTVKAALDAQFPVPTGIDSGLVEQYHLKLATAVAALIGYIQANAQVNEGILVHVSTSSGDGATIATGTLS